jgi:hypothetical protein
MHWPSVNSVILLGYHTDLWNAVRARNRRLSRLGLSCSFQIDDGAEMERGSIWEID